VLTSRENVISLEARGKGLMGTRMTVETQRLAVISASPKSGD
jgi:hypothetical protein